MISEVEKENIRKEAKNLLDEFEKTLKKTKIVEKEFEKNIGGFREEKGYFSDVKDFRELIFKNAPKVNKNFIVAEKKQW